MKRIVTLIVTMLILTCMFSTVVSALPSPIQYTLYAIYVDVNGTGEASADKIAIPVGETVTLTATETSSAFVFWNLNGEWEIVSGDQYQKVITIRPLSDIEAIATFEDGIEEFAIPSHDKNPISPKTGQDPTYIYMLLSLICIAAIGVMFGSYKCMKKK